jgi:hypothetical protein
MTDYREYRSTGPAAKPAIALIIGALIVAGAAAVGVQTLATPLPVNPAVVHTDTAPGLPGIPAR